MHRATRHTALWYPKALSYESFSLGGFLLAHTDKLIIASGIASIYARDATATKQGQHTLARLYGGRFLLGLGVSHVPLVETARAHHYHRQPVATMQAYLDAMDKAATISPPLDEPPPTVLAALGPQMTALAGQRTAGAFSYNVTPEHTAQARAIIGPDNWLCVEQKVLLVTDAFKAREIVHKMVLFCASSSCFRVGCSLSCFPAPERFAIRSSSLPRGGGRIWKTPHVLARIIASGEPGGIDGDLPEPAGL